MVKARIEPVVVYDPTTHFTQSPQSTTASEVSNFFNEGETDIRKLLKDVEKLGVSHMGWKERKKYESLKVVELGGKAVKTNRIPLSVAKNGIKKNRQREEKRITEEKILGLYRDPGKKKKEEKLKPEDRVLKATQGHFKGGVLNVKHLLSPPNPSRHDDLGPDNHIKRKGKGKGKKKGKGKGRKKGGGRRKGR